MAENIAIKRIEEDNRIKEYDVIKLKYLEEYSWMQVEYHVNIC